MDFGGKIAGVLVLAVLAVFLIPPVSAAEASQTDNITDTSLTEDNEVTVYFFWGDGCPHCAEEKSFLEDLEREHPELEVKMFEVYHNQSNQELFQEVAEAYGRSVSGVPATFIDDEVWVGYSESIGREIENKIDECLETETCVDPGEKLKSQTGTDDEETQTPPEDEDSSKEESVPGDYSGFNETEGTVELPVFGEISSKNTSLFVLTSLIAFVDGFNPCSLWVITFLLGLVIYSGSRKKVVAVGLTFLLTTTAAYGLFIIGLLNVFSYTGHLLWIRIAVAALALTFAVVNIKDYFWYKKGVSFTIPDRYKPKIIGKMREVLKKEGNVPAMIAATAGMALGIVLVELPCTAGFPVMWTNIIASKGLEMFSLTFAALLGLYLFIYLSIELVIFFSAVVTMDKAKLGKKQGRFLKLIGGTIMFALAMSLLFAPDLMESIAGTIYVFGGAVLAALVIKLIYQKTKGSEDKDKEGDQDE